MIDRDVSVSHFDHFLAMRHCLAQASFFHWRDGCGEGGTVRDPVEDGLHAHFNLKRKHT